MGDIGIEAMKTVVEEREKRVVFIGSLPIRLVVITEVAGNG